MTEQELREIVCATHALLPRYNLVAWTSGNVSGRVPNSRRMVIKPSGLDYEDLRPDNMVCIDIDDLSTTDSLNPSSDTATHAYIYREMPEIGGIVHTHSGYATAWSTTGRELPCILTAMADEFGGPIPCGDFATIGGEEIGREVVRQLRGHRSPAVLMRSHGVFTIGKTPRDAAKAAIMCEDVARTVSLAHAIGIPHEISREDVDRLHERYTTSYGQKADMQPKVLLDKEVRR